MYIATSALRSSSSAPSGPPVWASAVAMPIEARDEDLLALELERTLERREDPRGDLGRVDPVPAILEQDRELVAAEPGGGVRLAERSSCSRSPTSPSIRSPAAWPSESLIVLKSSRSMNRTETGRLSRA